MKTHEEIKKGLECCSSRQGFEACFDCPYCHAGCDDDKNLKDALAYIQQLEAQVPKWISGTERLPDKDERVLFFAKEPRLTIDTAYGWWVNTTNRYKITHWMPLPEPPKEG